MKMMQGAFFFPCSNRSRTHISTKSEPLIEKNGTFASPATARASSVLPVPGGPISNTPFGIRPPSFWNFCGSLRNSMISCSSSFGSSTPATSLKVTFFCALDDSLARLLPNDSALLPPDCTCRMKKIQKPTMSRIGAQEYSSVVQGLPVASSALTWTSRSIRRLTSPSNWGGAKVRNDSPEVVVPVTSLPVSVTFSTWPVSTWRMNSLNEIASSPAW